MEISAHSMQNIWATKVSYSNRLREARAMIPELLNCLHAAAAAMEDEYSYSNSNSNNNSNHNNTGHTWSIGIAILVVVFILGVLAGMVGRICSGRRILGYGGDYDIESWAETKCSSCIDGRINVSPPPPSPVVSAPVTMPTTTQEDQSTQNADS